MASEHMLDLVDILIKWLVQHLESKEMPHILRSEVSINGKTLSLINASCFKLTNRELRSYTRPT
jgi:hypothetical protein